MKWIFFLGVLAGSLSGLPGPAQAKEKPWVELTDCRYVENASNDGDSFRFSWKGEEHVGRLYFVDAPEVNLDFPDRVQEQSAHFDSTLDDTWRVGVEAARKVRDILKEPFVVRTRWSGAQGRGNTPRHYVMVEAGGKDLAETLVREGLAYVRGVSIRLPTGEKGVDVRARLLEVEREARAVGRGAWAVSGKKNAPAQ
jgi:endonuclease YncB( thermonuclease family)